MQGTQRTIEPTQLAVTLAEAKGHLHVTSTAEDADIVGYIKAATAAVERHCKRQLCPATFKATLSGFPSLIVLDYPPLISVTSIRYIDTNGVQQTLSSNQYSVFNHTAKGYIKPAYGCAFPATRAVDNAVEVTYTAGYSVIPADIKQALLWLIGHYHSNREAVTEGNYSPLPMAVDSVLIPYTLPEVC